MSNVKHLMPTFLTFKTFLRNLVPQFPIFFRIFPLGSAQLDNVLSAQAVIFPADTRTLSAGNIEISQEIQTEQGIRRTHF